nr:hypothetical protein BAR15_130043 [Bartonella sp. AR 15-3]
MLLLKNNLKTSVKALVLYSKGFECARDFSIRAFIVIKLKRKIWVLPLHK